MDNVLDVHLFIFFGIAWLTSVLLFRIVGTDEEGTRVTGFEVERDSESVCVTGASPSAVDTGSGRGGQDEEDTKGRAGPNIAASRPIRHGVGRGIELN